MTDPNRPSQRAAASDAVATDEADVAAVRNVGDVGITAAAFWYFSGLLFAMGYMAQQHFAFGDALAFAKTQRHWGIRTMPDLPEHVLALLTLEPIAAVYNVESPAFWARHDTHGLPWLSMLFANPLFFLAAVAFLVAEFVGIPTPRRVAEFVRISMPRRVAGFARILARLRVAEFVRISMPLRVAEFVRISAERPTRATAPNFESPAATRPPAPLLNRFEVSLSLLLLAIPYSTRGYEMGMASMGRFAAVAFPIYVVLGRWLSRLPPAAAAGLLTPSAFLMAAYSALFAAGYLIFCVAS